MARKSKTDQLLEKIEAAGADPQGFLIAVSMGKPVELASDMSFVPTMKDVREANQLLFERTTPKIKDVSVEHRVNDDLASRIVKARQRALARRGEATVLALPEEKDIDKVDTLFEGGTPSKAGTSPSVSSTSPQKSEPKFLSGVKNSDTEKICDAEFEEVKDPPRPAREIEEKEGRAALQEKIDAAFQSVRMRANGEIDL